MTRRLALAGLSALLLLDGRAAAQVVSQAARARVQAQGSAAVVVALRPPPMPSDARASARRAAALAAQRAAVLGGLGPGDLEIAHAYTTVPGFAGRVTAAGLARLAADPEVLRVDLDPIGHAAEDGVAHVRADRVQARGVTGVGSTIAVIDTGIEATHPDVVDALVHEECFCRAGDTGDRVRAACCPDGTAHASGPGSAASVDDHGPHVAGIAVSRGRVAPLGVAPGAQLVAIRVLDDTNYGFLSDWVAALDWLLAERPDVRVVNMSLVSTALFPGDCGLGCNASGCAANMLLADAIEQLWRRGTLLFAAAGNDQKTGAMPAPACIARAVAVGAVDDDDVVPAFSNSSVELDLLAPGVGIVSDTLGGRSGIISGTSMAAPHAAGVAALLLSARPGLGAADVERLLESSGVGVVDARTQRLTPRLDAFSALRAAMRGAELERGGGSRATDCLLEWNVVPPEIVQHRGWPLAVCRDNDPACDADDELGRCTFIFSPCFNMRDPLLRQCSVDEPLLAFSVTSPPVDAALGSIDRVNVDFLSSALPDFPFAGADTCSAPIPFVVPRQAGTAGLAHVRVAVSTATRRDYDHLLFECLPP